MDTQHTYRRPAVAKDNRPRFTIRPQLLAGLALLALGVGAFFFGTNAARELTVPLTLSGRFAQAPTWYILIGAVGGMVGLVLTLVSLLKKRN